VTTGEPAAPLKRDLFGAVWRRRVNCAAGELDCAERDTTVAGRGVRWLARLLASREARVLETRSLEGLRRCGQVPTLVSWDGRHLLRTWLPGVPLHHAGGVGTGYFREALRLVRRMHAAGVVHNDLAKEPNWLVSDDGRPALVDFQLAARPRHRGRRFRMLAYDDLRHLLKHKRTYCPAALTARQLTILARRSPIAALWARTGKPVYRFVTRRLLGWSDREGAGDRGGSAA
jgi:RIO-like serine/threonine protein kinase